jgi:hypothetical protein
MGEEYEIDYETEPRIYWQENPRGNIIPERNSIDNDIIESKLEKFFDVHKDIH